MGKVYRARDTRLDRPVAIKISTEEFSARFEREARAISALNHPHISTLYDVGPNYLVMELVEGQTLASHLKKGPLGLEQVLRYGTQIADALAAAHARRIVHRDLKPANIMITESGVKVLDFGVAKLVPVPASELAPTQTLQPQTEGGMIVGTVAYMSPEQAQGKQVDARSDLWSLGVILYEISTGQHPFAGPTAAVVFAAILDQTPVSVSERNPKVSVGLERIIGRLLEKDRELRYQSAQDVRDDLKRMEEGSKTPRAPAPAARGGIGRGLGSCGVDRGTGIHRHERREGPGLVLRRHRRRDPERPHAASALEGRGAHFGVFVQGQEHGSSDDRAEVKRVDSSRRQCAPGRRSRAHHGAVERRAGWLSTLVGTLRPRVTGYL
jgi:serine/threonine protein kinase